MCDMNEIYYNFDSENVIGNAYYTIIGLKSGEKLFFKYFILFIVHNLMSIIEFRFDVNGVILRYRQICSGR